MNINTSDLNFKGRYLLKGKNEQVNRAMNTIKQVKGDKIHNLSPCIFWVHPRSF